MNRDNVVDTTEYLFERYFFARVQWLQTTSETYLKKMGVPITGDRNIDNEIHNQWITKQITIAQMVDYYKEGVQIKIVSRKDVETIYEYVSLHIKAWVSMLQNSMNLGDAPIDDLIIMDRFATELHGHVKYYLTDEILDTFGGQFRSSVGINKHGFFKPGTGISINPLQSASVIRINTGDEEDEKKYPNRQSMGDFLKEKLTNTYFR